MHFVPDFYRKAYLTPKKDCALNQTDWKQSRCGYECTAGGRAALSSFLLAHYRCYPTLPYPNTLPCPVFHADPDLTCCAVLCVSSEIYDSQPDAAEFWANFTCDGDGYKILPGERRSPHPLCSVHLVSSVECVIFKVAYCVCMYVCVCGDGRSFRGSHRVCVAGRPVVLGDPPYFGAPPPREAAVGRVRGRELGRRPDRRLRVLEPRTVRHERLW